MLALEQFEKAQQCLVKAYQLDGSDPETAKDIGSIFLRLGNQNTALAWYEQALEIDNDYAPALNNIANIKRDLGSNHEAIDMYKRAIEIDPKLIQAYKGAAISFVVLGDLDHAASFAKQALAINASTPGINEILGIVFQNKSNPGQAIEYYQKELEINPKASNSLLNLGLLLLQQGKAAIAIEPLSKVAAINPDEQCSLLLAQSYQNVGEFKKAITEYKKLDLSKSQNKIIPFNLGLCLLNIGSNIDAIEAFKIAIKIDESFIPAWGSIATALINEGRHQEALAATKKILDLDPNNPTALTNLGGIYKNLGDLDQALTSTLKSLELKPDNPDAHANLGSIYQDLGNLDQALTSTLKSLELKPDNPAAHMNLGGIYKELGQLDQALAATLKSLELKSDNPTAQMNLGTIYQNLGNLDHALTSTLNSLELQPDNPAVYINLSGIYMDLGNLDQALTSNLKSLELKPDNPAAHMSLGSIHKALGNLDQALVSTLKSLELKADNPTAHMNLGSIYQDLGNTDQALASTHKSLELNPDNPYAHMNLGSIYQDLGNTDQALASTRKSLELNPDNPDAHMNLGGIHKELGNFDQALSSTLKSLELEADNPGALDNLKGFIDQLTLNSANAQNLTKAYELLINLENISHSKLSTVFIQAFLPAIQEAAKFEPIISAENNALTNLAADWRLRKSLTMLIPPHQDIEHFLTRLRKELVGLASNQKKIPENLKGLTEALATQCFLNEYVYEQSPVEEELVNQLLPGSGSNQEEAINQFLAIVACYMPIYQLSFNQGWIEDYPTATYESKTLIESQLQQPQEEKRIKATIQDDSEISDAVSKKVQNMYEENPYPRYRYADFTDKKLAKSISKAIGIESTKKNLQFSEALASNHSLPRILIAGCGTGSQVISSSRYKNAQITAIDLSSSSLAYAIRKARDYGMENVDFRKMDLLDVAALEEAFDTIECSGVLHHMEDPAKGLSALTKQLKPGGYIKLGLYSDIARKDIVIARKRIKQLGLKSTADSIRKFRQKVLKGEFKDLTNLPSSGGDFYSLSTCRDLCFHVQEHRYTTEKLRSLLDSHGLTFCGFMVSRNVKNLYQEQYPEDSDMISFANWGKFEEKHPSTFAGMYQFWAYKLS
ncbi:class I SAM-dependent methyltransferase [Synechococcus sp. BIOS-E4-1]|uniref:class I SAM-dependent methyltransferase n=1 Tax=Synechococcus sp. BIOS-E4-1 TaxID=1400864 RepID=UPI00164482F1|nr:class I SAM-dependent methyltransferase [Synechococcus sp. BIOS-E4-1]